MIIVKKTYLKNHEQQQRGIAPSVDRVDNTGFNNSLKKIRPVKLVRRNLVFSAGKVTEVKKQKLAVSSKDRVVANRGVKRSRNSDDDFELDRIHPKKRIRLDLAVDIEESVQVQRKRKRVYSDADLHEMTVMHPRKKVRCDC